MRTSRFVSPAPPPPGATVPALNASFRRTLRAEDKSERTVKSYTEAVGLLAEFLGERGHPLTVNAVKRADVRDFIADQLERWKPATALNRYRSLQAFFKWCVAEGELKASPMVGMKPPQLPDEPPPVLTDDQLRRLLKSCDGRDFTDRRDTAIIRLFIDTGVRVSEAAGIMLPDDLDLDDQVVIVLGKGRRPRAVPFGRKTALAIDRYLRLRASHTFAYLPNLWIGRAGAMTPPACSRSSPTAARASASPACTPTSSATPSPTPGSPPAAMKATSCAWPAGSPARWSTATPNPPPSAAPAKPTATCPSAIGSNVSVRRHRDLRAGGTDVATDLAKLERQLWQRRIKSESTH
jgi:site-specific recombinase XerC